MNSFLITFIMALICRWNSIYSSFKKQNLKNANFDWSLITWTVDRVAARPACPAAPAQRASARPRFCCSFNNNSSKCVLESPKTLTNCQQFETLANKLKFAELKQLLLKNPLKSWWANIQNSWKKYFDFLDRFLCNFWLKKHLSNIAETIFGYYF